ncbi:acyl-CoA dehydrogenase family protein, partial [Bacillus subtilis]
MHVTQEQVMMRKMVRDFARKEIAPAAEIMEKTDEFPFQLIKKMGKHGLMGIPVPEQYGGAGADVVSYILAIHEISRISAAVGVILSVHTSVGTNPILYFGNEEQKMKYIPNLASGDH